jgi:hypothetical protein
VGWNKTEDKLPKLLSQLEDGKRLITSEDVLACHKYTGLEDDYSILSLREIPSIDNPQVWWSDKYGHSVVSPTYWMYIPEVENDN